MWLALKHLWISSKHFQIYLAYNMHSKTPLIVRNQSRKYSSSALKTQTHTRLYHRHTAHSTTPAQSLLLPWSCASFHSLFNKMRGEDQSKPKQMWTLHFLPPVTIQSDAESVVSYSNKSRVTIFNTMMREREAVGGRKWDWMREKER